jgi:hypothetical protein
MNQSSAGATMGVGLVGYAFMGTAHSQAWRSVNSVRSARPPRGHRDRA